MGFSVLQLVVTDKDSSHNGPPFFFAIVSGNDDKAFEVNQQGVLLTSAAIQRNVKDHYLLHVKVLNSFFMILLWIHRATLVVIFLHVNSLHFMTKQQMYRIGSFVFCFMFIPLTFRGIIDSLLLYYCRH